jgi:hypothetical protein
MYTPRYDRRLFVAALGCSGAALLQGAVSPAFAAGLAATPSMRGGSNNYSPNAPLVERLGSGFWAPLKGVRVQIWAATTLGGEREPRNHGSVLTAEDGNFRLETEQIVPNFGQPHAHLAYDDGAFETVWLGRRRPANRGRSPDREPTSPKKLRKPSFHMKRIHTSCCLLQSGR